MFELLGPLTTSTCDATTATHHMDEPPRASPSSLDEEYSFLFTSMFSSSALFFWLLVIPASLLLWDMKRRESHMGFLEAHDVAELLLRASLLVADEARYSSNTSLTSLHTH